MEPQSDTDLIAKCIAGEIEVYQVLVDRYSSRIVNVAYMMIGDRHEAEDVAQDAFVRAYKALPKFQHKAKFSSWLYQIALNLCKDFLKSKARSIKKMDDEKLQALEKRMEGSVSQVLLEAELSEGIRDVIYGLPELYREVFVLRHLQGVDYDDVAEITNVPADTVRVRAYRARELLRSSLAPIVDTYWKEMAAREKNGAKSG
ncbi:MAG: RNA polymerase sigma factor [Planctomycetota bacterium]|nr:RNA polymerase sigma factor [Planctomycetota bacterium]